MSALACREKSTGQKLGKGSMRGMGNQPKALRVQFPEGLADRLVKPLTDRVEQLVATGSLLMLSWLMVA